ncbi:MAG: acireductone synthase [Acidobacteria bacterium]|nr:acireductone synthase [Acidobacteriota bacterium]MBI3426887.1 acireductone synthase [Acidobacteriota bacterium]
MTTIRLNEPVPVILLDIEGTTTPIDFVYQVLFPYARLHLKEYLALHWSEHEVQEDLLGLRAEHAADVAHQLAPPVWAESAVLESAAAYLLWLMEQDRKSTALKSLQGKIWATGYRQGELRSVMFEDVPRALARWYEQERRVCLYSSGSVLAQKLLFAHTTAGDLTSCLSGYFDTTSGPKRAAHSYQTIAAALAVSPAHVAFISDVTAELEAAHAAGLQTLLAVRPGNAPAVPPGFSQQVQSFDEVFPR